jgi:hypothetical protein
VELNFVENLVRKKTIYFILEHEMQGDLFISKSWTKSDNMDGRDLACRNGNYEMQTKSSLVHN